MSQKPRLYSNWDEVLDKEPWGIKEEIDFCSCGNEAVADGLCAECAKFVIPNFDIRDRDDD